MDLKLFKAEIKNPVVVPGYLKSCMFFAPSVHEAPNHLLSWIQASGVRIADKAKINIREIPIPDSLVFMVETEPQVIKMEI